MTEHLTQPPRRIMTRTLLTLALAALVLAGCELLPGSVPARADADLVLSFDGLDPLAGGFHYEGWAIVDGRPVSTGKFNVDRAGLLVGLDGRVLRGGGFEVADDITGAAAVVVTIEPPGDTDAVPAATKIMGGDVSGAHASLAVSHGSSLGDAFMDVAGTYILATPTDGGSDTDERSGVWFLDPSSGAPMPGLTLPTLPAGWRYEGWAVIDGHPVTTGTFTDLDMVDDGAPFSGALDGPPFPGEDFLTNAPAGLAFPTDLSGGAAVISVEPFPDDSPMPFTLKPLVGPIPADASDHHPYTMNANPGSLPTGTARLQ